MNLEDYDKLEKQFESVNAFQCKHCGNLIPCDSEEMEEHLDECEKFKKKAVKEAKKN